MAEARTGEILRDFHPIGLPDGAGLISRLETAPDVVVVIPVHNGGQCVAECISSVVRHTPGRRIIVIDDGTTDAFTLEILDEAVDDGVEVIRNAENIGYTRTANRAIELAGPDDLVLLNSDTVVGPMWLQRLRWSAYSRNGIASASAVSDNAGAFAVPLAGQANAWTDSLTWSDLARVVGQSSVFFALEAPTAHGFCVYLRRDALDAIGGFDEASFPRGYGEENDWSMRALGAGMSHVMSTRVFVKHAQGASFGNSRAQLIKNSRSTLDALHPSYGPLVGQWMRSDAMSTLRQRFAEIESSAATINPHPRTLYVIHQANGGTPETNRDLMDGLVDSQESYLLIASERGARLEKWYRGSSRELAAWQPKEAFSLRDTWRADYAAVVARWIIEYSIELVHVRHLINQPLTTIPRVTELLGIPMILSTHDFYYICPTVHLLDENLTFCGGTCTPGEGPCRLPTRFTKGAPNLKHSWVNEWKRRASTVLESAAHVIATTESARSIYAQNYPAFADKVMLIEHGRDLGTRWPRLRSRRGRRPGPLRIACPARWDPHKGSRYLASLIESTGLAVEWHILGDGAETFGDGVVVHGTYRRNALTLLLDEIDPDFVGLFSIWPETYSHTLTEAWALGVPVIATDIGAVADRIRSHGGGQVFPVESTDEAARYLLENAEALASGELVQARTPREYVRSRTTMAQDYALLYAQTRERRSAPVVGYVMHGDAGIHTPSGHVRLRRQLTQAAVKDDYFFRQVNPNDFVVGTDACDYSAIIVQRDSLPAELVDAFIVACRKRGVRIIFEIDDDLTSSEARRRLSAGGYDTDALEALERLLENADFVTVSTDYLADRIRNTVRGKLTVIPNELDSRLWCTWPEAKAAPDKIVRVLYMGSSTHNADLELLRPVFEGLKTADGRSVVLEVIGVTSEPGSWFTRLTIPNARDQYPRFVPWLREHRKRWALGVAPLIDEPFNLSKSDLKLLEYGMLGLPSVASDVGPYRGHDGHGVHLVENRIADWRLAILGSLNDAESALSRAAQMASYVALSRTLGAGKASSLFREVLHAAVAPVQAADSGATIDGIKTPAAERVTPRTTG